MALDVFRALTIAPRKVCDTHANNNKTEAKAKKGGDQQPLLPQLDSTGTLLLADLLRIQVGI